MVKFLLAESEQAGVDTLKFTLASSANHVFRFSFDDKLVPERYEEPIRKLVSEILGDYNVVTAKDGAEALETAMENAPDLVITDIRMPDMDGYTLLMKLREFHPDVPVIALSGFAKDEDIREYDFDGFVAKPMKADEFKNTVAAALASR